MTSTAEEKTFLSVAVAAIPRVAEIILEFPPDDRAGALETAERRFLAAALDHDGVTWTMLSPGDHAVALLDRDSGWLRVYADAYAVVHARTSH